MCCRMQYTLHSGIETLGRTLSTQTTEAGTTGRLGTFVGVFTPSILTILGIILFLRLGYVVGNAGLRNALIIIGIGTAVSLLTSISLAAIATNIEVKGGGDYYLISRTLGIEFGGAIGIVLFLAQSVSIAFYAIGFAEATAAIAGFEGRLPVQAIAAGAVLLLFVLAWLGADAASRFQFVVMAFLILALLSFYIGAFSNLNVATLTDKWTAPAGSPGFWVVFAIFFPAVTGFTQGVSMSGDLRDPTDSLPKGTFAAVGLSTVVYISVAILLAATAGLGSLASDSSPMGSVSAVPFLIDAGVIAATLSSAMASFMGAPRILQSLAADRVFPMLDYFAVGHGETNNPRRGVLLSLGIALATIGLGSLNAIAPIVSMFFLISYGLLNYATYYEANAGSPSFRPRFRYFNARLSLLGAIACFIAMIAINIVSGMLAGIVLFGVYTYLQRTTRKERWADASRSHYFKRATESIKLMAAEEESARNWRPQILAFSADPARRGRLMQLADWLEGSSGLSAVVEIIQGSGAIKRREREERKVELKAEADDIGVDASLVVLAPDAAEALPIIVQSYGVGPLRANTVLLGLPENAGTDQQAGYARVVRDVIRLGVNIAAVSSDAGRWEVLERLPPRHRRIDVWWKDDDSGRLALLLAYLFTRNSGWQQSAIRVLTTPDGERNEDDIATDLKQALDKARIPAEVLVLPTTSREAVASACGDAALVMIPSRLRRDDLLDPLDNDLYPLLEDLPMAAAIVAATSVDLIAGPESGVYSELAAAEDRVASAQDRLKRLTDQANKLENEVKELRSRASDGEWFDEEQQLESAEAHFAGLTRRVAKAQFALDLAEQALEALENGRRS